jgi:hypothetical protein
MHPFTFRSFRITVLLGVLVFSAVYTVYQLVYSRSWQVPLEVVIFPISADKQTDTQDYIDNLSSDHFYDIEQWFAREAKRYQLTNTLPIKVSLGKAIDALPPGLPRNKNPLLSMLYGAQLRWWAFRNTPDELSNWSRVRVFVLYHGTASGSLPSSLGLQKGLLGVVNAYAESKQNLQNNVVVAHEVMHTLGATDKYQADGNPVHPEGYANPDSKPLHPQIAAEIMAGRVPITPTRSRMVYSLKSTVVSPQTAREINWVD